MITANKYFNNLSWQTYYDMVIIPALVKHGLLIYKEINKSAPLSAYINRGRWAVKCECGGGEYAWEEGIFMCQSCFNGGSKHQLRRILFPEVRREIEELLHKRPLLNRNWYPNETLAQLEAENKEHESELLEVK